MRQWRERRRRTQLDLALDAGVSARHLSFVENGRSKPGAEIILRLAEHLDLPLRERNRLLLASASQLIYFINAPRRVLVELALGNGAMAAAGLIWLGVDHGFSAAGAALLSVAIAWKLTIGLLQTRSLKPRALQRHH